MYRWGAYFRDRAEAGRRLADRLTEYRGRHPLVLAVPRGGVPVGAEVARALGAPLDIIIARKLGAPGQPELAIGATTVHGDLVVDELLVRELGVELGYVEVERRRQAERARAGEERFAHVRPGVDPAGRTAILVDDGLATGSTLQAAVLSLRRLGAAAVVVAVPVASQEGAVRLSRVADDFVSLHTPADFGAVGAYYQEFGQVPDEEVERLLAEVNGTAR